MSIFWKEYKEYIVTLTIACFGIVFVQYGILPMHQKIQDQLNKSQEILVDREIRDELVASLSGLREQNDLVKKKENQLGIVIAKNNIVNLVKDIEAIAKEKHIDIAIDDKTQGIVQKNKVNSVKPIDAKKDEKIDKTLVESLPSEHILEISIKVTGSYDNIVQFIHKLESMPYETDIIAMSLSVPQASLITRQSNANIFSTDTPSLDTPIALTDEDVQSSAVLPIEAVLDTVVYITED